MTSSSHTSPFDKEANGAPLALNDEAQSANAGRARIRDVDTKLDAIQRLVQKLFDTAKQPKQDLTIRRKRHKRETRQTAEAIRRAKQLSDVEAIIRAGQRNRVVDGIDTGWVSQQGFSPIQAFQDFAAFVQYLPPELVKEIPWTPFVYSLRHMYMPEHVHQSIAWLISDHNARNREYQELMQAYLHLSADRMADISPCYIDVWHSYIPSMAFGEGASLGLLSAMVALAALQIAPLQTDQDRGKQRAMGHYITAISHLRESDNLLTVQLNDATLATALILAHYELWNGEITKMGLHMLGSKKIIIQRGMAACQTPLGRALFAFYLRSDCGSSVVTGNPVFLDDTWWKVDPLYDFLIPLEAPILLAADAAMAKLCVIIAKLTVLKSSAQNRRKRMVANIQNQKYRDPDGQFAKLEDRIRLQVLEMQRELEAWHRSLPAWFGSLHADQMADGEEDINQTTMVEISPQRYPHHSIAVILVNAFAANIQLWRVLYPDEQNPPPRVGALVHALLRAYLAIPSTADAMTIGCVWIAALLLRQQSHRLWLENQIRQRIRDTDFFGWKFAYHGILFQWGLLDGTQEGRFQSMPTGAQEIVPGVSENLWRADGIMNTKLADLTVEEEAASPEGQKPMYRFKGDAKLFDANDDDSDGDDFGNPNEERATESPDVGRRVPLYLSFIDDY